MNNQPVHCIPKGRTKLWKTIMRVCFYDPSKEDRSPFFGQPTARMFPGKYEQIAVLLIYRGEQPKPTIDRPHSRYAFRFAHNWLPTNNWLIFCHIFAYSKFIKILFLLNTSSQTISTSSRVHVIPLSKCPTK